MSTKQRVLYILLIVGIGIFCFISGISFCQDIISKELDEGPIFEETYLTTYLQRLYNSAYGAGMMRGLANGLGYGDYYPKNENYWEWMHDYDEDPEEAVKQEGYYWLQNNAPSVIRDWLWSMFS